jgi:hypothetical protein
MWLIAITKGENIMTGAISFPDKTQFPMSPDETYQWVSSYGATFVCGNGSQSQYRSIEPSEARLVVNVHSEAQTAAIDAGNKRYKESQSRDK